LVQRGKYDRLIQCDNVFHFRARAPGADAGALLDSWLTLAWPYWRERVNRTYWLETVAVRQILPYEQVAHEQGALDRGFFEPAYASPCVCAGLIQWRTALEGRRRRGRTYVVGLTAFAADGIHWSDVSVADLQGLADGLLHLYGPAGVDLWELGVWSPTIGGRVPPLDPDGFAPIEYASAVSYICTMGSRRLGRGN
jgi:hypothetical protein